ncbi:pentatricopeptide repeat-containing protein At5g67570, chloroplastic, partial [Carica papaya]|uniref:pentatricopeptide repeat-containing protein At5g67570, chloroplastic n=1 Tax=Carica papaya TaxID=3649 RepID=UPI000B8CF194
MDASTAPSPQLPLNPPPQPPLKFEPDTEKIKQTLLKKGVHPTPKILRALRKKETQKHNRKSKRLASEVDLATPLTESQRQALAEESHFQTLKREYKRFSKAIAVKNGDVKSGGGVTLMVGKPWEGIERVRLKELASSRNGEFNGDKLRRENLRELMEMLERDLQWVLEDDVDVEGIDRFGSENREYDPAKRWASEGESIRVLVDRLSRREITETNWKFVRIMKQSGLQFTENQMLKIVERLGGKGCWRQAMAVVRWIYADKERRHFKSRFVFTKLLSVLGSARRPQEALRIFNLMLGDCNIYPDMAAYHSIAVTLGQGGLLRELLKVIECMRQKPKKIKHMRNKNWDPVLEPDCVVYNAVMLESGKYDLVHEFFRKMKRAGEAPKALTYKVLVRAFWKEGKINEAVETIRDMERRGVIGTASVYYELACCLCNSGRWRDAMVEVDKIKKLPHGKPLEVTFTGLISSSMDGGHVDD